MTYLNYLGTVLVGIATPVCIDPDSSPVVVSPIKIAT